MAAFPPAIGVARADHLVLCAAVAAYLGRYRGQTRLHTESDLRVFLRWCADEDLDPLAAVRADIERYLRWLQDVRRYQPSTVSRRLSVVVGFYRVCVIDAILPHSPADYVRRPTVPAESPTPRPRPSAVRSPDHHRSPVRQPQRLPPGRPPRPARAADLRSLRRHHCRPGRGARPPSPPRARQGGKVVLIPLPLPPAVARAIDRAIDGRIDGPILRNTLGARWTATPPPAG